MADEKLDEKNIPEEEPEQEGGLGRTINTRRNSTFIFIGAGVILLFMIMFQFVSGDTYLEDMKKDRAEQQDFLKRSPSSPIPDSLRANFDSIAYFPLDKAYRVNAKFVKHPTFEKILMPRTSEGPEVYIVAGKLEFLLNGQKCALTAYQGNPDDSKSLFVPFRDLTSGKSTYGGGRYLDVRLIQGRVVLDFNKAYNPYCVFNYFKYACPIPPEENNLPVAVEAGEKKFDLATIGG